MNSLTEATRSSSDAPTSGSCLKNPPEPVAPTSLTGEEYDRGLSLLALFRGLIPIDIIEPISWPSPRMPSSPEDSMLVCRTLSQLLAGHKDETKRQEICAQFRYFLSDALKFIGDPCSCTQLTS